MKVFRLDITPEQAQSLADELSHAADAGLFHPSIVEPIAAGVEGTVAYRAEEYVAAESLDVAIRHYAPAPLEKVLPFITQLAGAIDFARAAGIGHGALHLRDVFVSPDEARAGGFGVVEALERVGLRAPVRRPYTAPERIAGQRWSTPADVFSLAAIAFELLTGRRPAGTGDQMGALSIGDHEAAVHRVLARAMDDDPGIRYPNALALASALDAASRGVETASAVAEVGAISGAIDALRPVQEEPVPSPEPTAPRPEPPAPSAQLPAPSAQFPAPADLGDVQHDASLFDDEAAADLGIDGKEPYRFADEFGLAEVAEPRVEREEPFEEPIREAPAVTPTPLHHEAPEPVDTLSETPVYAAPDGRAPPCFPWR